jgi:hypothetical protein
VPRPSWHGLVGIKLVEKKPLVLLYLLGHTTQAENDLDCVGFEVILIWGGVVIAFSMSGEAANREK